MITTRTRILSILATVAMLVSMLACFVIPASADESITAPYAALLEDVPEATSLAAVIDTATEENTLSDALQDDITAGRISWPTWKYGEEDYPRYAHKAVYNTAGYTGPNWSIDAPQDWIDMITDSASDDFYGCVFHVTQDIDFDTTPDDGVTEGIVMKPLSYGENALKDKANYPFNGTIEGYGHAFKNINVQETVNNSGYDCVTGMIGKLGPYSKINNFGVDSGKIQITKEAAKSLYVSTFGEAMNQVGGAEHWPTTDLATQYAELNNVWSGATIIADGATVAGIECHSQNAGLLSNGAYFFGVLQGTTNYAITTSGNSSRRYNVLSNTVTAASMIASGDARNVNTNLFSVGDAATHPVSTSTYTGTVTNGGNVGSPEEGAWEINKAQPAKGHTPVASGTGTVSKYNESDTYLPSVYFTITGKDANGNIIRPTGTELNQIVKVNISGVTDPLYVNLDTEQFTKDELIRLTGNANIIGYSLDNGENTVTFDDTNKFVALEVNADKEATITFKLSDAGALTAATEKYNTLLTYDEYLTAAAVTAIETFLAEVTEDNLQTKEATLRTQLKTYATYEEIDTDGKDIPGYSLKSILGDYNNHDGKQVWAISSVDDWTDMVADSVENDFSDCIFHVTDNIDFDDPDEDGTTGIEMDPLNLSASDTYGGVAYPFNGTIEGNGHAFKNINVTYTFDSDGDCLAGMIGYLGGSAVINDFGVESGSITVDGTAGKPLVATFGGPAPLAAGETGATLTKVWSGVTINSIAKTGTSARGRAVGIVAYTAGRKVTINGAHFFGTLAGTYRNFGLLCNVAGGDTLYNALCAPIDTNLDNALHGDDGEGTVVNAWCVGDATFDDYTSDDTRGNVTSAWEGAWKINGAQDANDENAVYFTKVGNDIRFGERENRIVLYNFTINGDAQTPVYANAGSYTADDLKTILDLYTGEGVTIKGVTQGAGNTPVEPSEDKYGITEDVVNVTVEYGNAALCALKAEELQDYIDAYDAYDANLVVNTDNKLTTFKDAVEAVKDTAENSAEKVKALNAAIAAGEAIKENEAAVLALKANLEYPNFPAYKDHALYEKYTSDITNWMILTPADWYAMDAYANAQATDGDYFAGTTFHLNGDVDFDGEEGLLPLGIKTTNKMTFAGTIDGHGFGFENVDIDTNANPLDNTSFATVDGSVRESIGLIGYLGNGCTIQNFGVNSGTILGQTGSGGVSVSTFGTVALDATVNFNKVWSGAVLYGKVNPYISALAGIDGNNVTTCAVNVNGFTFYGETTKSTGNYNIVYGIMGGVSSAPAAGSSFANIITYPTTQADRNTYLFGGGLADLSGYEISNVYGIKKADAAAAGVGFVYDFRTVTGSGKFDGNTTANVWVKDTTPETAALTINNANTGAEGDVYFKLAADGGIRPTGTQKEHLVEYTVIKKTDGTTTSEKTEHANSGEAVDVAALFGLAGASKITVKVNGEEITPANGKYEITGNAEITAEYEVIAEKIAQLQAILDTYAALTEEDEKYLKFNGEGGELTGDQIGLAAFRDQAETAIIDRDAGKVEAAIAARENLVVQVTETNYPNFPAYKDHAKFDNYQPTGNANWMILTPADWYAMDAYANAQATDGDYFAGTTFHLNDDVDFDGEEGLLPLGIKTTNKMTFAGTIDGHGFGFENVDIDTNANPLDNTYFMTGDDSVRESIGLIGYLGDGCTIQNFGVNSGTILGQTGSGGVSVSTFGTIPENTTVNFTKVWSGAVLYGKANPFITPLAGLDVYSDGSSVVHSNSSKVIVNGFTFYGETTKNTGNYNIVYGIMGGLSAAPAAGSSFANIITYPTTQADRNTYLFGGGLADLSGYTISNVYGIKKADRTAAGIGFEYDYRTATGSKNFAGNTTANVWVKDTTPETAALTINNANTGAEGDVYFKLVDGDIRPTGNEDNHLIRVRVTDNGVGKYLYFNKGDSIAITEEVLGATLTGLSTITVDGAEKAINDTVTAADGMEIVIVTEECDHKGNESDVKVKIDGKEAHHILCSVCGEGIEEEACADHLTESVYVPDTRDGTPRHIKTCVCGTDYSEDCTQGVFNHDNDCTTPHTWTFTCGIHEAEYTVANSSSNGHVLPDEWTKDEHVADRLYKACTNPECQVKKYQYEGHLNGGKISVKALKDGEYVIELPGYLASATLTFAMDGEYTYEIEGASKVDDNVYTVNDATEVKVKVTAKLTAKGGSLTVDVTDAKAYKEETYQFGDIDVLFNADAVDAVIEIAHDQVKGDATGDGNVNLQDALFALYVNVGKDGYDETKINMANVDTIDVNNIVDIKEVYEIVKSWLSSIVNDV